MEMDFGLKEISNSIFVLKISIYLTKISSLRVLLQTRIRLQLS